MRPEFEIISDRVERIFRGDDDDRPERVRMLRLVVSRLPRGPGVRGQQGTERF